MANPLIQSDPDVMLGKPVVRGSRITVETILRKLSCGESIEQLLESHPRLTREAVLAALDYAAEAMGHEAELPGGFTVIQHGTIRIRRA